MLVESLYSFHLTGHVHGDPRVDNVLLKDGQLKWIDFMHSTQSNILAKVNDFSILFSSLTGVDVNSIQLEIKTILNPTFTESMSRLSTNIQSLSEIDELKKYLGELWSFDGSEEGFKEGAEDDEEDEKKDNSNNNTNNGGR